MEMLDLGVILAVLGLTPLAVYLASLFFAQTGIFLRVGGERQGEPIPVPPAGRIHFGVSTTSRRKITIEEVRVECNPVHVSLEAGPGLQVGSTLADDYSVGQLFTGPRMTTHSKVQGFFSPFKARNDRFNLRFVVYSKVDETELPFLLDMLGSRRQKTMRLVRFEVDRTRTKWEPRDHGIYLDPGEALMMEGPQAQEAIYAQADHADVQVEVREFEETKEGPS